MIRSAFACCLLLAILSARGADSEVQIDAGLHPLGEPLRAVFVEPPGEPVDGKPTRPACLIAHGSGGLWRENDPGDPCGPDLESNFRFLADELADKGVASLFRKNGITRLQGAARLASATTVQVEGESHGRNQVRPVAPIRNRREFPRRSSRL